MKQELLIVNGQGQTVEVEGREFEVTIIEEPWIDVFPFKNPKAGEPFFQAVLHQSVGGKFKDEEKNSWVVRFGNPSAMEMISPTARARFNRNKVWTDDKEFTGQSVIARDAANITWGDLRISDVDDVGVGVKDMPSGLLLPFAEGVLVIPEITGEGLKSEKIYDVGNRIYRYAEASEKPMIDVIEEVLKRYKFWLNPGEQLNIASTVAITTAGIDRTMGLAVLAWLGVEKDNKNYGEVLAPYINSPEVEIDNGMLRTTEGLLDIPPHTLGDVKK